MKLNRQDRREETAAIATMILVGILSIICIVALITTLMYG